MDTFLIFVLFVALFIRWVILSKRFDEIERRIGDSRRDPELIDQLFRKVRALETDVRQMREQQPPVLHRAAAAESIPAVEAPPPPAILAPSRKWHSRRRKPSLRN